MRLAQAPEDVNRADWASTTPVRLEVKLIEVWWAVSEFIKGGQHDLFLDTETVKSRLTAFEPERD